MNPNDTRAFPSLDAWKRTREAREEELQRLYKRGLNDIKDHASRGKDTLVLHLDGSYYEVERIGWWIFGTLQPSGRLKQLIEMFSADGFTVSVNPDYSHLIISWNL